MSWLAIYGIGALAIVVLIMATAAKEPTAHGQSIIFSIGCLTVVAWPLALPLILIAAVWSAYEWAAEKVRK